MSLKSTFFIIVAAVFLFGSYQIIWADKGSEHEGEDSHITHENMDSNHEKGEHEGHSSSHGGHPIGPPMLIEYTTHCGECHVPFRPELMPSAGWEKIFSHLDDHFGESVDLDDRNREGLLAYLKSVSADRSFSETSRNIMNSLGGVTPERITEVPYIKKQHHEIDPAVFERASIGRRSNCIACHDRSVEGIFEDEFVHIPDK